MTAPEKTPRNSGAWLFSARVDLTVFVGSALLALVALAAGGALGLLNSDTPRWAWVPCILLIDVAHVWSTAFRVYLDPEELKRRLVLYLLVPLLGWALAYALYSEDSALFWRVLAYLAVFHFVRQQYGWVSLYRARAREPRDRWRWLDSAAIYVATVYPLLYWHSHLPRDFHWFLDGDFGALPGVIVTIAEPIYWLVLLAYGVRSLLQYRRGLGNPGKDVVVATTVLCWHVGVITFNSDYAFTVTNVIIHGVPYMALVYWYRFVRRHEEPQPVRGGHGRRIVVFLATIWMLAYLEELIWDRGVWTENAWLFGSAFIDDRMDSWLVPLLAVPQLTHYILDGFIWRRASNPSFDLVQRTATPDPK